MPIPGNLLTRMTEPVAGKAFAVVTNEIKELARQTSCNPGNPQTDRIRSVCGFPGLQDVCLASSLISLVTTAKALPATGSVILDGGIQANRLICSEISVITSVTVLMASAIRFGLTVTDLATTVHVYPSISDGLRQAAERNAKEQELLQHSPKIPLFKEPPVCRSPEIS